MGGGGGGVGGGRSWWSGLSIISFNERWCVVNLLIYKAKAVQIRHLRRLSMDKKGDKTSPVSTDN
jgi:hypothetical protein